MQLEIVSPERVLLKNEVSSVIVPGENGIFQVLENHAPIVSVLEKGFVRFQTKEKLPDEVRKNFFTGNDHELSLEIAGGVIEMKDNKVILLID